MKKNKSFILLILFFIILIGIGIFLFYRTKQNGENSYQANRTSYSSNNNENNETTNNSNNSNNSNNASNEQANTNKNDNKNTTSEKQKQEEPKYKEEQIATFPTKIYSKDSERQHNIEITCNTLNDTTVKNGETFSFCNTVGKATTNKGYQKADIYDHNGNKTKGLRWWKLPSK